MDPAPVQPVSLTPAEGEFGLEHDYAGRLWWTFIKESIEAGEATLLRANNQESGSPTRVVAFEESAIPPEVLAAKPLVPPPPRSPSAAAGSSRS